MKTKVLFLCTGNSARSQMAEAFLRAYAGDHFEPHSAGLDPRGIHPCTIKVMDECGFNLEGHKSKSCVDYLGKEHFGYLITVCDHAERNCPSTFLGMGKRLHWSFEDPAAFAGSEQAEIDKFRDVRDQIDTRIRDWLNELEIPVSGSAGQTAPPVAAN